MRDVRHCAWLASLLLLGSCTLGSCTTAAPDEALGQREQAYQHPLPPGPPYAFYLTTFGAGADAQNTSCGKWVDGSWWYSTGVYHWGCGAKVKVEANGKCGVVEVTDNGPAAWVEQSAATKCAGAGGVKDGYILDASPKLSQHLFGVSSGGWSDCYAVLVTPVDKATPPGPCQNTGPICGDNKVDPGETCDPPSSCPTNCNDGNACTADALHGSAALCTAACQHTPISACQSGDGCCPTGCTFASDSDCPLAADSGLPQRDSAIPLDGAAPHDAATRFDAALPAGDAAPPPKPPAPNGQLSGACALAAPVDGAASLPLLLLLLLLLLLASSLRRRRRFRRGTRLAP